jgi:peptide/nickel transport system permease protein
MSSPNIRRRNQTLVRYSRAFASPRGLIGAGTLLVLVGLALAAPLIGPGGYDLQTSATLTGASGAHLFGTDELGRDILVRTVYGLRTDLSLIFTAVPVSLLIGTLMGLTGAVSKALGAVTQRVLDIILGFPGLVLGVIIVMIIGEGWWALFFALVFAGLPGFGRMARAGLLAEQDRDYVLAARVLGVPTGRRIRRHILPNIVDPLLVQTAIFGVVAIFIEAGLSIVGLGIKPPAPSLGAMLNLGARYATTHPGYVLGPGLVLLLLALSFTLLSDALNEAAIKR